MIDAEVSKMLESLHDAHGQLSEAKEAANILFDDETFGDFSACQQSMNAPRQSEQVLEAQCPGTAHTVAVFVDEYKRQRN